MKKILFKLILFFFGLILIFLFIFIICPKDETNYMAAYIDKLELLNQTTSGRIIFIGGSNLAFGLDSEKIESYYKKQAVNTALHAGLGLKFILSDITRFLNNGDIVIISPEYPYFDSKNMINGEKALAELILKYYPYGLRNFDSEQLIVLLVNIPNVMKETLINEGLKNYKAGKILNNPYQRGNFNKKGDVIGHLKMNNIEIPKPPKLQDYINTGTIDLLNKFNKNLTSKGIICFFMYPVYRKKAFELSKDTIMKIDHELRIKLEIPILGNPENFEFDNDLFYDTDYHLNKKGREIRTEKVISLIDSVN